MKAVENYLRDHDLPVVFQPEFVDFSTDPSAVAWRDTIERPRIDADAKLPI